MRTGALVELRRVWEPVAASAEARALVALWRDDGVVVDGIGVRGAHLFRGATRNATDESAVVRRPARPGPTHAGHVASRAAHHTDKRKEHAPAQRAKW